MAAFNFFIRKKKPQQLFQLRGLWKYVKTMRLLNWQLESILVLGTFHRLTDMEQTLMYYQYRQKLSFLLWQQKALLWKILQQKL